MNIIYIITDQQRYDTINTLGYPFMETPNIDKLVKEGCTFSNCFAAKPRVNENLIGPQNTAH